MSREKNQYSLTMPKVSKTPNVQIHFNKWPIPLQHCNSSFLLKNLWPSDTIVPTMAKIWKDNILSITKICIAYTFKICFTCHAATLWSCLTFITLKHSHLLDLLESEPKVEVITRLSCNTICNHWVVPLICNRALINAQVHCQSTVLTYNLESCACSTTCWFD